MEWYLAINGEPQGPYEEAALRSFVGEGLIPLETLCWNEELLNWTPLEVALPHLRKAADFEPGIKPQTVEPRAVEIFRGPPIYPWAHEPNRVWPWLATALALHAVLIGVGFLLRQAPAPVLVTMAPPETMLQIEEMVPEAAPVAAPEPPPVQPPEPMTPPAPPPEPPPMSEPLPEPATPPDFAETVPIAPPQPAMETPPVPAAPVPPAVAQTPVPPAPVPVSVPVSVPTTTAPSAVSMSPEEVRPSDNLFMPRVTYPYEARKRRQEGRVELLVEYSAEGLPIKVAIHKSSGVTLLDNTALQHVKKTSRLQPGTNRLRIVPIVFNLRTE